MSFLGSFFKPLEIIATAVVGVIAGPAPAAATFATFEEAKGIHDVVQHLTSGPPTHHDVVGTPAPIEPGVGPSVPAFAHQTISGIDPFASGSYLSSLWEEEQPWMGSMSSPWMDGQGEIWHPGPPPLTSWG